MTLLYVDGFDHYATAQLGRRYTASGSPSISTATKRTGYSSLSCTTNTRYVLRTIPASGTVILGLAVYLNQGEGRYGIVGLRDTNIVQCGIQLVGGSVAYFVRGSGTTTFQYSAPGSALGTPFFLPRETWFYLEFKVVISDAPGGSYEVRVNGNTVDSGAGVDTRATSAGTTANIAFLQGNDLGTFFDDWYICDGNGAVNNDFLGDRKVETLLASGAGTYAEWTPSAGSNYQNVDEQNCDDDTTYNSQDNTGLPETDSFAMGNLAAAAGNVAGVQTVLESRNDDAGPSTLAPFFRIGGSDYARTTFNPGAAYTVNLEVEETNPDTGVAWTVGDVNGAEYGYRRSA